jgi:small-conductance mechanosensitive channel
MSGVLDYPLFRIGDTTVTTASLAVAVLVLVASYALSRLARRLVTDRMLARTHLSTGVRYMLGRFTGYLVFFLGALMALQTVGIRATTLTAFGAALGVGIGFGLQDVVKNFVAGLVLLIERPFQVGDRIEVNGVAAEVIEIRSRATVLRTNDDVHLIVPNSRFVTDTIVNRAYDHPRYRCRVPVAVDHGSNPKMVEEALLDAAGRCDGILKEPSASVRFRSLGASGLNFELLCWTGQMFHRPGALISCLNFEIHESLTRRGIRLPQTEILLRRDEERPGGARPAAGTEDAELVGLEAPP